MALERRWRQVPPRTLLQDGGQDGLVSISDTIYLRVKQKIKISAVGEPDKVLEVKRIVGPTRVYVGPVDKNINSREDISAYTVAKLSTISAEEQDKRVPSWEDQHKHSYEQEPILARRVIHVDPYGDFYTISNPMPVQLSDGSIEIGTVNAELEVQLSHRDNYPDVGDVADSVQIGDGEDILRVNPDGSISTADSGLDRRIDVENNIVYEGVAEPGTADSDAGWRISRTVKTPQGDLVTTLAGTGKFDQVWDDRLTLFPATTEIDFFERRFERLLPLLSNANWMKLGNFDRIAPTFTDDAVTMSYFESGAKIGQAEVRYVNELDWEINLERYINDTDGDMLLDDDDDPLFLD